MANVTIYTTRICPFCVRAKYLLKQKNVEFTEIDVGSSPELKREMIARSGRQTVPQIFIDDLHVGGCDDLYELDLDNKLDPLLK
ncbi:MULTISPECIES: glutaredoxin 3 [Nitrincola]|uniref:Glutaredoxin n=1 Tax=Nitrincola nitratireducens TaxID=1229521 RepID=W9UTM5_9GAMM|nr:MULTISPECIES: glutaredoxin 3 [Nitrincola]EXJ10429.1 Glutaredoxin-3 [Nitrincola nitratireducens]